METTEKEAPVEITVESKPVTAIGDPKKDRVKWSFDPSTRLASVSIGILYEAFDLSTVIELTATDTQKALMFYGFKQWVSSNWAAFKGDNDKITSAKADYADLISAGLEMTQGESGVTFVKIVGKTTAKGDRASVSKTHLNSQTWSLLELKTLQKAKVPFTPEMTQILQGLEEEEKKQNEINAIASKKGKK